MLLTFLIAVREYRQQAVCIPCVSVAIGLFLHTQVTPLMHNPFPGGRWSDKELPSLLRNLALIGALLLLRTTANVKKPKKD